MLHNFPVFEAFGGNLKVAFLFHTPTYGQQLVKQWDEHSITVTCILTMVKGSATPSFIHGIMESINLDSCMNFHVIMSDKYEVNLQSRNHGIAPTCINCNDTEARGLLFRDMQCILCMRNEVEVCMFDDLLSLEKMCTGKKWLAGNSYENWVTIYVFVLARCLCDVANAQK